MNKINHTLFEHSDFKLMISVRLTDANLNSFVKPFKMQNGYIVSNYDPKKMFIIRDRKTKEEVGFRLETIYDLKDILAFIYKGMKESDVFFHDSMNALVPNHDEIKKYTVVLKNEFNKVKIRPDVRRIEFEDIEGISFTMKANTIFLEHGKVKELIRLLMNTDILTYAETLVSNAILLGGKEK